MMNSRRFTAIASCASDRTIAHLDTAGGHHSKRAKRVRVLRTANGRPGTEQSITKGGSRGAPYRLLRAAVRKYVARTKLTNAKRYSCQTSLTVPAPYKACSGFTHVTARRIAQPPKGDLCHEAPTHAVTRTSRSSATRSIDNSTPLMIRAFGAHCHQRTFAPVQTHTLPTDFSFNG